MTCIPSFIGVGAEKSATTWCWACLNEHPDVYMSHPKEINYFNRDENYANGTSWYLGHFADAKDRVCGEISPLYLDSPKTAELIARDFPETTVLAVLRNPFERALSHLLMDCRAEIGTVSTLAADVARKFAERDKYVRRSLYAKGLEPYLSRLQREQVKILFYEDMVADPAQFVRRLYNSVGVADNFVPSVLHDRINQTGDMRYLPLFRFLRQTAHLARKTRLTAPILSWAHRIHLTDWVIYKFQDYSGKRTLTFDDVFPAASREAIEVDIRRLADRGITVPDSWVQCD